MKLFDYHRELTNLTGGVSSIDLIERNGHICNKIVQYKLKTWLGPNPNIYGNSNVILIKYYIEKEMISYLLRA